MRILITGGNFVNQGAYLMLAAAVEAIRDRLGGTPVLDLRQGTERQKRSLGVDTLWTPKVARTLGFRATGLVPRLSRGRLPYLMASEIDAVLDVSGFRYGDAWEHIGIGRRADYLEYWHSHGVPVVLLPQAFGPFERTSTVGCRALGASRLVIARDPDSLDHVLQLRGRAPGPRIEQFPDFTAGLTARPTVGSERYRGAVPIVPNWNILERGGDGVGGFEYIRSLAATVTELRARGLAVYGLSHEGAKDVAVLDQVAVLTGGLEIVSGLDGRQLKGLLGTARAVVAGRFHALVSALSQGVPSVIHGWSHKYRWLAEDFDATALVADPADGPDATGAALDLALGDPALGLRIATAATRLEDSTGRMWDLVARTLDLPTTASPAPSAPSRQEIRHGHP